MSKLEYYIKLIVICFQSNSSKLVDYNLNLIKKILVKTVRSNSTYMNYLKNYFSINLIQHKKQLQENFMILDLVLEKMISKKRFHPESNLTCRHNLWDSLIYSCVF